MMKIAVILEKSDEGGFTAHVPTLPGCFSEGESIEEALANIAEAIEIHVEAAEDDMIVEDDAIVRELLWEAVPPRLPSGPDPSGSGTGRMGVVPRGLDLTDYAPDPRSQTPR